MIKVWIVTCVAFFLFLDVTFAQKTFKTPPAEEMISNVAKGFGGVKDFVVDINAEIKMERMQIPKMAATMYFKKPDKIHFDSQSFLLVPREGIALNPTLLQERYSASLVGYDTIDSKSLYKLLLAAKEETTRLRQLYVWIDPSHWTISKIETIPYEGRTLSLLFSYELQQGKYWLPSTLVAAFGTVTGIEKSNRDIVPQPAQQFEELQRAAPRSGMITIVYSHYRLNVGLDDALFEKKEK